LITGWLGVVDLIALLQSYNVTIWEHSFELAKSALLTLIGSTTGSVLVRTLRAESLSLAFRNRHQVFVCER
jgi:hypothetical protein